MVMKETLIVPTHLKEITLGQMQYFYKHEADKDENERNAMALSVFCGAKHSLISKAPRKSLQEALITLSKTLNQTPTFQERFTMNGIEYGFIPNLDQISLGEFIDIEKTQGDFQDLHKLMAILYRPLLSKENNRYSIKPYKGDENADAFKDMPLDVALGSKVFFWNLGMSLVNYILNSLKEEEIPMRSNNHSIKNGGGTEQFTDYVKTILGALKVSHPYPYTRL